MNTGHNHHQGDFHTDDIQDAEFQDAEIIDEIHEQEAPKSHHQATAQDSLDVEIEDETKDELPEIIIKKILSRSLKKNKLRNPITISQITLLKLMRLSLY